jgi:hypothetical protein
VNRTHLPSECYGPAVHDLHSIAPDGILLIIVERWVNSGVVRSYIIGPVHLFEYTAVN